MTSSKPKADSEFDRIVKNLLKKRGVTVGGKGFGSSGLKFKGKLFAMISSRGQFVAKLPKKRVEELVRVGKGEPFDPGHGRLMREWLAVDGQETDWAGLAGEALAFVSAATNARK
jgi:hypothetical protein